MSYDKTTREIGAQRAENRKNNIFKFLLTKLFSYLEYMYMYTCPSA